MFTLLNSKDVSQQKYDGFVKSDHMCHSDERSEEESPMKTQKRFFTRTFPTGRDKLFRMTVFCTFYETVKYNYQKLFNRMNKELGPGFLESIYHKALEIRFSPRVINERKDNRRIEKRYITWGKEEGIKFESEKEIAVSFHKKYYAQVRSYLKAVNKDIGLLINFSDFKLDSRRVEKTWR